MQDYLNELKEQINSFVVDSAESLENYRLEFTSRKGKIPAMFTKMKDVPAEMRSEMGKLMNEVKVLAETKFKEAQQAIATKQDSAIGASDDPSLHVLANNRGSLHPLSQTLNEMKDIFYQLGFSIAFGPELEDDFHNFTALNFPPEHPARDMQDTFFIRKSDDPAVQDLVLRTHTSPVQVRMMLGDKPPYRAIMPGRVYRNESITAKSYCLFHQVEGLYVDKGVSFAELKETLITFAQMMYGADVKYRMRPSYFPFTEPSLEMDVWWENDKGGQWLEILGAGMVDPNVLKAVDLNPEEYSGFAFGMGVERICMLRYGINDIRLFYDNDVRFLEQFG